MMNQGKRVFFTLSFVATLATSSLSFGMDASKMDIVNAIKYGKRTRVGELIKAENFDMGQTIHFGPFGCTVFQWAYTNTLSNEKFEMIKFLLENGAQRFVNVADDCGVTPLIMFCKTNEMCIDPVETIKLLFKHGAKKSINISDKDGRTPLYWSCSEKRQEQLRLLLESGANIDQKSFMQAQGKLKILALFNLIQEFDQRDHYAKLAFIEKQEDLTIQEMLIKRLEEKFETIYSTPKRTFDFMRKPKVMGKFDTIIRTIN
jgi:FOG: Ankyrin repeat